MSIDTQAYLFVHFIGEERNPTDEQLYFALSRDGVHWRDPVSYTHLTLPTNREV